MFLNSCLHQSQSETSCITFQWWLDFYLKLGAVVYYKYTTLQENGYFKQIVCILYAEKL
jgi:hypothetical protein